MGIQRKRLTETICAALSGHQKGWYLAQVTKLEDEELAAMAIENSDDDETIIGYLQGETHLDGSYEHLMTRRLVPCHKVVAKIEACMYLEKL